MRALLLAAGAMLAAEQAHASAFQLREGDPDWLANAFAGDAAKAYDAGTAWNNPAGMTRLGGDEIDLGLTYFDPGIRFHGQGLVNGRQVEGYSGGDAAPPAVTPGQEIVHRLTQNWWTGLAVEAPFGLRTAYPPSFVGRYQALVSSILNVQVAASLAYRVSPEFSIGGGPVLGYLRARLTQAIDTTLFVPDGGSPITDTRGEAYAAGYHFGALYEVTPEFRIGADYHSRMTYDVHGKQTVTIPDLVAANPFVDAVLRALNAHLSTQVTLPDVATFSTAWDVTPDISLYSTVQWTHWSLLQALSIRIPGRVESTPLHFRNTGMGALGANWKPVFLPRTTLQAGILYDEGANTDSTRGPRLPDESRLGLSGGVAYMLGPRTTLRVAYLHEFAAGTSKIEYGNGFQFAGTLVGKSVNNADVLSAGMTMKF